MTDNMTCALPQQYAALSGEALWYTASYVQVIAYTRLAAQRAVEQRSRQRTWPLGLLTVAAASRAETDRTLRSRARECAPFYVRACATATAPASPAVQR